MDESIIDKEQHIWQAVPAFPRLLGFQILNATSFQIALGPPLILMARHWGASSLFVGCITALVPLLTTLQLYMAPRVEYIGFRKVMLSGWTGRNIFLALCATLPFLSGYLSDHARLTALFAFMFCFNTLRGYATASWMPWISALVPSSWRGRFVSAEHLVINLSSAGTFFLCGRLLGETPTDYRFGWVYLLSVSAGFSSLFFLKSIESPPPRPGQPLLEPIHIWVRRVWQERPSRRLIRTSVIFSLSMSAWGAFTILFLRDEMRVPESAILYMSGASTLGGVISAWGWGILADRFGSRPVMSLATRLLIVVLICWLLLSLGLFSRTLTTIVVLYVLLGIALIGYTVGNTRYLLNNAPRKFPVLALTLFSVTTSLSNALTPIFWGSILDVLRPVQINLGVLQVGRFGIFYSVSLVLLIVCKMLIRRLPDHRATATHVVLYYMINDYPLRTLNALYKTLISKQKDNS